MGRLRKVACVVAICIGTGALGAPVASADVGSPSGAAITSFLQTLTPKIQQVSNSACLGTPSATVSLTNPVAAGDTLVLVVAGQGYGSTSPTVTGVSDNVNGAWTQLANAPAVTPDQLHYLSYSVYKLQNSLAAPNGLTITVNQLAGQSSASAIAFEVNGRLAASAFNDGSLALTSNGVMSAPQATPWNNPLDLSVGLFGAYQYGQSFNAGSGWTMSAATNCTAAIEISSAPTGGFGWNGAGTAPVPTVDVSEPTYYMAGTLNFGFSLTTLLNNFPQLRTLLANDPQLNALLASYFG
jgi:hypothetical protein